jgi:pimeloyl-ACP methyl ester carboxylesterase
MLIPPDLFGRGYSENPAGHDHDVRLYTTQILLALASSPLPWLGSESFHLIGYSFGGGLSAAFARFFPATIKSLTLIAPGGLLRQTTTDWKQRLLYSRGLFPQRLLQYIVRRRLAPPNDPTRPKSSNLSEPSITVPPMRGGHDTTGGDSFDGAGISRFLPTVTVEQTMAWQVSQHRGFVPAFMSSMRHGPIFEQYELWSALAGKLRSRKLESEQGRVSPLRGGKVLFVLGQLDPVIKEEELRADANVVLGDDLVEYLVMNAGHELVMTKVHEITTSLVGFWNGQGI